MEPQTKDIQESSQVVVRFERGVLIATIMADSLLDQLVICEIEESVSQELQRADRAVLVDCTNLVRPVSSQFLSVLMRIHNQAEEVGLPTAVCGLSSALKSAYDVTTLTSIIPAYETQDDAISEFGELDNDHVHSQESVWDLDSPNPEVTSTEAPIAATDELSQPVEPQLVTVKHERGVLVARVVVQSLIRERTICDVEDRILEQLAGTESAILVDCSKLTQQVSSQFLSMLMRVHYRAKGVGLRMAVCGLSEPLREAYRVTALESVVPSYQDEVEALRALRKALDSAGIGADADAETETCSSALPSAHRPLAWLTMSDRSSVLLVLGAVALVALGFLAGVSLNAF